MRLGKQTGTVTTRTDVYARTHWAGLKSEWVRGGRSADVLKGDREIETHNNHKIIMFLMTIIMII